LNAPPVTPHPPGTQALLPGGSVTALNLPGGARPVIARGSGSHLWDIDGREYVDYLLGSGPLILGHAHPEVIAAVTRQAALGSTYYMVSEPVLELASRIVQHVPCAQMVQFCVSGSEATFYALRIARAATGRSAVLKFEGGFHGANDYALMSLNPSGPPDYPRAEPDSAGIPPAVAADVLIAPYNDLDAVSAIVTEHSARLAAILVEPYQRVIEPVPGFLQGLRRLADAHGLVLIFDEVVTGFRFGPGGAQQRYGVTPDLVCLGKIIGGGYPLAAVAGQAELIGLTDPSRHGQADYVYMSGTLNGNPIAAAAGNATLAVLEQPGSYERLFTAGERIRAGLRAAFGAAGVPAQVLGVGPIFQVVITDIPVRDFRSLRRGDQARIGRITQHVVGKGHFLTGQKAYLSLAHTDAEIDATVAAFADALEAGA
jgi:glutamate-1-semialdehyde 2,1-aminomutase